MKELESASEWALVQSDKTNQWIPTRIEKYVEWMKGKLDSTCKEISVDQLGKTLKKAQELLARFRKMMDAGEYEYLENWIGTRQVPTPHLLIKEQTRLCSRCNPFRQS